MGNPAGAARPVRRGTSARQRGARRLPAAARRRQIERAFIQEALARGSLAGVGVRAVLERAGCTAPVLYRLFGDRDGLVRAAVRSTHLAMIGRLEAIAARDAESASARLRSLAARTFPRRPGSDEAFEALVANECRADRSLAAIVREVFARYEALLVAVLEDGMRRGELRSDLDPPYAAWRLIDLALFRNQVYLLGLARPAQIGYAERAFESLLAEIVP